MINLVPFHVEHLRSLDLQPAQAYMRAFMEEAALKTLEGAWSYTANLEGKPVACGGLAHVCGVRAVAWSYLSEEAGVALLELTRLVRHALEQCPYQRVEITVDVEFAAGHRWARMLGFELEANLRKARIDGGDCALYARVR